LDNSSSPFVRSKEADPVSSLRGFHLIMAALGLELPESQNVTVPEEIQEKAQQRWDAKQAREWAKAYELRNELAGPRLANQGLQGRVRGVACGFLVNTGYTVAMRWLIFLACSRDRRICS